MNTQYRGTDSEQDYHSCAIILTHSDSSSFIFFTLPLPLLLYITQDSAGESAEDTCPYDFVTIMVVSALLLFFCALLLFQAPKNLKHFPRVHQSTSQTQDSWIRSFEWFSLSWNILGTVLSYNRDLIMYHCPQTCFFFSEQIVILNRRVHHFGEETCACLGMHLPDWVFISLILSWGMFEWSCFGKKEVFDWPQPSDHTRVLTMTHWQASMWVCMFCKNSGVYID